MHFCGKKIAKKQGENVLLFMISQKNIIFLISSDAHVFFLVYLNRATVGKQENILDIFHFCAIIRIIFQKVVSHTKPKRVMLTRL